MARARLHVFLPLAFVTLALLISMSGCTSRRRPIDGGSTSGTCDTSGTSEGSGHQLVLDYADFGPQAMAYELIGFQWFQWLPTGGPDPDRNMPIKVVVYHGLPLELIRARFPVSPRLQQDFRYVEAENAKAHVESKLNETMAMMGSEPTAGLGGVGATLRQTLARLQREFP